jgi:hypothetical protein
MAMVPAQAPSAPTKPRRLKVPPNARRLLPVSVIDGLPSLGVLI